MGLKMKVKNYQLVDLTWSEGDCVCHDTTGRDLYIRIFRHSCKETTQSRLNVLIKLTTGGITNTIR